VTGDPLRAAGGVVVRKRLVLVVHRPKYDDWAFPKGKLEPGESWEHAALREVEEETSLRCTLGPYLGATHYELREGTKEVRYFLMTPGGDAVARNEVDELRWVPVADAPELLTYPYDRELLATASDTIGV
jgi:8-oxo-dGTP diphosphatase